jgi:hypothetical protein
MANDTALNTPVLWINKYLQAKISELTGISRLPFFPTQPSTLDALTQGGTIDNPEGVMATSKNKVRAGSILFLCNSKHQC